MYKLYIQNDPVSANICFASDDGGIAPTTPSCERNERNEYSAMCAQQQPLDSRRHTRHRTDRKRASHSSRCRHRFHPNRKARRLTPKHKTHAWKVIYEYKNSKPYDFWSPVSCAPMTPFSNRNPMPGYPPPIYIYIVTNMFVSHICTSSFSRQNENDNSTERGEQRATERVSKPDEAQKSNMFDCCCCPVTLSHRVHSSGSIAGCRCAMYEYIQ